MDVQKDIQKLFVKANQELNDMVLQVRPDRLDLIMPRYAVFHEGQTLRDYINICAHENACVPPMLAGKKDLPANAEVTEDYLKDDFKANYAKLTETANRAVLDCSQEDLDRIVHMSYGDAPASGYLSDIIVQRSMVAVDIAQAAGIGFTWSDQYVQQLLDHIKPFAPTLREYGIFPEEVAVRPDAPLQSKLIALMGRQP